jgi:Ca-activated chloride channel family protein
MISEELSQFHFSHSIWFLGLLVIPIICFLYSFYYQNNANTQNLEKFVDKHLIPHLIRSSKTGQISIWRSLILGSVLWAFLMAAMAGPRWDFKEFENHEENKSLVILLDLSKSMDASDINPTRLIRARQEIEDIINLNRGTKIGLIGFAENAHIIAPITNDMSNIRILLPFIGTDLVFVQGTKLKPALITAKQMLHAAPGFNKSILVISDGGFQDIADSNSVIVKELVDNGIIVHTLGVATEKGISFADDKGQFIKRDNQVVVSRLEKKELKGLSKLGKGMYFDTHYSNKNTVELLNSIEQRSAIIEKTGESVKHWEERFYIFLFPIMLTILLWFRKGFTFPIILLVLLTPVNQSQAVNKIDKLFLNEEQYAKKVFEETNDIGTALKTFKDPYKRGVAYYRAGRYLEAEKSFKQNNRPEVFESSMLNLGNALAKQDKIEEAVEVYIKLLEKNPKNFKSLYNLAIVKGLIFVKEEIDKDESKKRPPPKEGDKLGGGSGGGGGGDDAEDEDSGDKGEDDKNDKKDDKDPKDQGKPEGDDDDTNPNGQNNGSNKSEDEINQLLDLISSDHKKFLKNQFFIESQQKNLPQTTNEPW